jgi:hypothetical protein
MIDSPSIHFNHIYETSCPLLIPNLPPRTHLRSDLGVSHLCKRTIQYLCKSHSLVPRPFALFLQSLIISQDLGATLFFLPDDRLSPLIQIYYDSADIITYCPSITPHSWPPNPKSVDSALWSYLLNLRRYCLQIVISVFIPFCGGAADVV